MSGGRPIVIAHRGASAYLPEHTLAAKAVAHTMGADYIEQDVVLTADSVPIVLHDIYLDSTTNVAALYPGRARDDGRHYAMDFSLSEVRALSVHERRAAGQTEAAFPRRFPTEHALFRIPTLLEEIDLIEGLNRSRGRNTGLYIELKAPNKHRENGLDLVGAVLGALQARQLDRRADRVYLQCFDDQTLRFLHGEIKTPLPLIQLIADSSWEEDSRVDYDYLRTEAGLDYIAGYAQGVGPWLQHLYLGRDDQGSPLVTDLVSQAQRRGLQVHPYTFRADQLPTGFSAFEDLLQLFIHELDIDGLFTDFPDLALAYLAAQPTRA